MSFTFYKEAQMKTQADTVCEIEFKDIGQKELILFFGSPYAYEMLKAPYGQQIVLTPVSRLKKWQANRGYSYGSIVEPTIPNGCMYQCISNGNSGSVEPVWDTKYQSQNNSGSLVFVNLGAKVQLTDVSLALSRSELNNAIAGRALNLGDQLQGGTSVPIFIKINNADKSPRSDRADPCIGIELSPTTTETIVHTAEL